MRRRNRFAVRHGIGPSDPLERHAKGDSFLPFADFSFPFEPSVVQAAQWEFSFRPGLFPRKKEV
jgi:hypothetical protein